MTPAEHIQAQLRHWRRRDRLSRAAQAALYGGVAMAAVGLITRLAGGSAETPWLLAAGGLIGGAVVGLAWPVRPKTLVRQVDAHLAMDDRLTTAAALLAGGPQTPAEQCVLQQASERFRPAGPLRRVDWRWTYGLVLVLLAAALVGLFDSPEPQLPANQPARVPLASGSPDDLTAPAEHNQPAPPGKPSTAMAEPPPSEEALPESRNSQADSTEPTATAETNAAFRSGIDSAATGPTGSATAPGSADAAGAVSSDQPAPADRAWSATKRAASQAHSGVVVRYAHWLRRLRQGD